MALPARSGTHLGYTAGGRQVPVAAGAARVVGAGLVKRRRVTGAWAAASDRPMVPGPAAGGRLKLIKESSQDRHAPRVDQRARIHEMLPVWQDAGMPSAPFP